MTIYLVYSNGKLRPGEVLAIFAHKDDADSFSSMVNKSVVVERTLFYGQPPMQGYNK